ncbi:MAG: universal stress protein [Bacteroidales bacterium]|nr:universal stress protein [Bacteroidales bacterium]
MDKIIVGFDLSRGSRYALDLSVDIANRWEMDLRLVYVNALREEYNIEHNEQQLKEKLDEICAAVTKQLRHSKADYVIRQGRVPMEIAAQAKADSASLVVVGTHGTSGFETNWIGKNTYRIIALSDVPVLIVREDFNFNKALEHIVLPLDSTSTTRQKVPMAAKFAQTFGSTIHVLGLYTSESQAQRDTVNKYVNQVHILLDRQGVKHQYSFVEVERNLTVTTLEYAERVNADMIVIMTEQESSISNLLLGSYAQQMLHLSKIPVLSIQPEDIGSLRTGW